MKTLKKNLVMVIGVMVMISVVGNVGAEVYTTGTSGEGTIGSFAGQVGAYGSTYTTYDNFTVDGQYLEDVWAIVISEMPVGSGQYIFNGYGYSAYGGFQFVVYGDSNNPFVPASLIIPIINDGDPALFEISNSHLTIGLGLDVPLSQTSLSINGGLFGDISEIVFDYSSQGDHPLDSVVLNTPEPATLILLGLGGLILRKKRK